MPSDSDNGNKILWAPAVIGASVGAGRMARDVGKNYRNWFTDLARPGRNIQEQVVSSRGVEASPMVYANEIERMATERSWSRLPNVWSRRAVAEATRASLLQGASMPIEQIDVLTRNILAPRGYPDFFDRARQQVAQYGDQGVFTSTLQKYFPSPTSEFSGQATPGVFFGEGSLNTLFNKAQKAGIASTWISKPAGGASNWFKNKVTTQELGILSNYMKGLGAGASVQSIVKYPGSISMANLNLNVGGLAEPINLSLPLHATRYRKPQAEYVMNKIFAGLPSRGGQMMSWGDYYVKQVGEKLIPQLESLGAQNLSSGDLKRMAKQVAKEFDTKMTQYMMWTPGIRHPGLDFINNMNSQMVAAPDLAESVVRNALDKPDVDAEMRLLYKQGLFPGISGGQIASGRMVGGMDPRAMWAYGADFPFERRPLQFMREFAPTSEALAAMQAIPTKFGFSRTSPILATSARRAAIGQGLVAPQLMMGYALKGGKAAQVLKGTGLAAEELLTRQELMPMFQTERITTMKLGLHEAVGQGKGMAKWLSNAAAGKVTPLNLIPGQQLGYELKTGRTLKAADLPGVTQQLIGAQFVRTKPGEEAAQLFIREVHSSTDYVKLFGQLKATTRARDAAYMFKVEKDLGIRLAQDLDAFAFADELRKNRSFLKQQMASGLGMLAQKRLSRIDDLVMRHQMAKSTGAWKAAQRIENLMDAYDRSMSKTTMEEMRQFGRMSAEEIQAMLPDELAILKKGKSWGLDIRLIGGAMEEAGDILPAGVLDKARKIAGRRGLIHPSGMVVGAAISHVGAYRHTMGGGILEGGVRGSIEPRGIMGLLQHNWMAGKLNVAHLLAAENLRLMGNYGPDINEILKMGRTMAGEDIKGLERITAWAAEGKARTLPMRKAGYMLELGTPVAAFGGASAIYVPGSDAMHRFGQFRGEAGEILQTELAKKYNQLARAATRVRNLGNETTAVNSLNLAANELTKAVMGEAGKSMYGRGGGSGVYGALRGKRLGSQFLAMSSVDELMSEAQAAVVEVSKRSATDMFRELEQAAATASEREFIKSQRKAFMSGKSIAGQISRHPYIGPYSIQPTLLRLATGPQSATEYFAKVPAYMEESLNVLGEAQKTLGKKIVSNLSPIIGLAADYDDDRIMIGLIGNEKVAKATSNLLHTGRYMREYRKFAAEAKVLNELAKGQLGASAAPMLKDLDKLVLGSSKLRIAQAETPAISLALSEAKLATSYYKPQLAPKFNLIAEIMEQQILSGKKMKEVSRQNIAATISSAIEEIGGQHQATQELQTLAKETEKMFGPELRRGIELESAQLGKWSMQVDPEAMWKEVQSALQMGRDREGIITRYKQFARGRTDLANLTVGEVVRQIEGARAGKTDMLSMLAASSPVAQSATGKMGYAIRNALGGINRGLKEVGAVAKTWYRPAFWGLAGTAAAVMLSGGPKGQVMQPPPRPAGGDIHGLSQRDMQTSTAMLRAIGSQNDMRPEALAVPGSMPTDIPNLNAISSPSTYMSNSMPLNYRVVARANVDGASPDYDSVMQAMRGVMGDAKMRINFRDNRARLTSQAISDMLEEP